jgi:hypothetical protein
VQEFAAEKARKPKPKPAAIANIDASKIIINL